tara:strand:+ start:463 stop:882 length:420 start_codon:yes stop_codon:yes gene_type:complete
MRAKNYRKGVRTYRRLQEQLGETEPETIDVEWIHADDPIYDSFPHPRPQTINQYHQTIRSYGSISEVKDDPKTIRVEMEHHWREGHHPPPQLRQKPMNQASPKTSGVSGTDLELMFVFGFGGSFACWMFISIIQILMKQ